MRIGVFTALWGKLSFEEALDRAVAHGLTAVEIGTGGLPGNPHCPTDELLESATARQKYLDAVARRGLIISALSVHDNPLHPDKDLACKADEDYRKAVRLAALLNVPVVNTFSGCPGGSPDDKTINWITCPWPPEFTTGLNYQWNDVAIPYWQKAAPFAADHGIKVGLEMHPGMMVYNVYTLLRLREEAIGPVIRRELRSEPPLLERRRPGRRDPQAGRRGGRQRHLPYARQGRVRRPVQRGGERLQRQQAVHPDPRPLVDLPLHRLRPRRTRSGRTWSARCGWSAMTTSSRSSTKTG